MSRYILHRGYISIAPATPTQTLCQTQQWYNQRVAELFLFKTTSIH